MHLKTKAASHGSNQEFIETAITGRKVVFLDRGGAKMHKSAEQKTQANSGLLFACKARRRGKLFPSQRNPAQSFDNLSVGTIPFLCSYKGIRGQPSN